MAILIQTYYRLVPVNMGKVTRFLPDGYYERMNEKGIYDDSKLSEHLEVCFGASIPRCVFGIGNWLRVNDYYVYETNAEPCLHLNQKENPNDYQISGEVRYRNPVEAYLIGKVTITKEIKERFDGIGERIGEGWDDVSAIIVEVETIGEDLMKLFVSYEKETVDKSQKIERDFQEGEVLNVVFSKQWTADVSFVAKSKVIRTHILPSGTDLLLEDEEGQYWIHGEDEKIEKIIKSM